MDAFNTVFSRHINKAEYLRWLFTLTIDAPLVISANILKLCCCGRPNETLYLFKKQKRIVMQFGV